MFQSPDDRHFLVDFNDGLLRLTLNRPEYGNAMPPTAVPGLLALFRAAQANPAVRCIMMDGNGKIFCAGGDVGGFGKSLEQEPAVRQASFAERLAGLGSLVEAVASFDRPFVVAVRGAVAGAGLLYPLIADYVLADGTAAFAFAHQRVGLSPDGGVSYFLPQVVGVRTARTLLLTAAKIDAAEALRLGILSRIVPAEQLEGEFVAAARRFAAAPQRAVVAAKRLVNHAGSRSLGEQLKEEGDSIVACVGDPDFEEGVKAFLEKRRANFPSARIS